jgi:hypothetical protein
VSDDIDVSEAEEWSCSKCGVSLETSKVEVAYMGSKYPVDLPGCPLCGLVFIPERLALGKMARIEQLLEDK